MPGEFTGPDRVESLLERHPALTLLIAHMGNSEYGRFLDLAERFERVHLDTTMAFTDFTESLTPYPREYLPRLVDIGDKVVLGSD
ncbi:amidohydrolase family protein, partial [Xanthomonas citri pv. citri]|nr:amidohydrolase family protein [Xanthomonas citri pv. citri]